MPIQIDDLCDNASQEDYMECPDGYFCEVSDENNGAGYCSAPASWEHRSNIGHDTADLTDNGQFICNYHYMRLFKPSIKHKKHRRLRRIPK